MKNFVRHLLLCKLLAVSIVIPGFGQEEQKKDTVAVEMAKVRTNQQIETLILNESQKALMYEINLKYIEEMLQLRNEGRSISTLNKLTDMNERMDNEVVLILDKDQYKKYLKMKDERRKEMMKRMKSQSGNG